MPQESMYAAVDIGTSKIISIVARLGPEGELKPLGTGVAPSNGVQQGVIDDFGEVKNSLQESMAECLRYVGRNPVDRFHVVVNGDHLVSVNSTEMLGSGEEVVTITDQRLRSLMSSTSGSLEQQLDSRSEQTLHMIPMRYRLDGMTGVRNPTGLDTSELQLEAHIVRGMSVPLGNTVRALQSCKAKVDGMIAHPLASAEGVLTADEREMGVVVVDIGAGTIKTAIYREGTPIFSSVVPMGGNQLTRDMAVAMRVPYQMAEDLKVQFGHVLPDAIGANEEVLIPATQVQPRRMVLRRGTVRAAVSAFAAGAQTDQRGTPPGGNRFDAAGWDRVDGRSIAHARPGGNGLAGLEDRRARRKSAVVCGTAGIAAAARILRGVGCPAVGGQASQPAGPGTAAGLRRAELVTGFAVPAAVRTLRIAARRFRA